MTQYQKAQRLAAAFKRQDKARAALEQASREVSDLVGLVGAGRSTSREDLRKALVLSGLLEY